MNKKSNQFADRIQTLVPEGAYEVGAEICQLHDIETAFDIPKRRNFVTHVKEFCLTICTSVDHG